MRCVPFLLWLLHPRGRLHATYRHAEEGSRVNQETMKLKTALESPSNVSEVKRNRFSRLLLGVRGYQQFGSVLNCTG